MISGYDIVIFSYADFFSTGSTPQHMGRLLAEQNRVLFVDMPRSFLRPLKGRDPQNAGHWEGPPLKQVEPNLHVFHPPHRFLPIGKLPYPVMRAALACNSRMVARMVQGAMRELKFENPILWNFSPMHGDAVHRIPGRLVINDIADEWMNYIHYESGRRLVETVDCELSANADITFVFSKHMHSRRAHLNPETHITYPAGDVPFYARARDEGLAVPEDIAKLRRPVVGAICVVDSARFDPALIDYLGRTRPEWSIVILGPVRKDVDLSGLEKYENVHIFGDRAREMLPAYLKGMDVCMVPYALNDATRGIYPMKIQEYLSAGKGVVMPALPECLQLAPVVKFAESYDEYAQAIESLLANDSPAERAARVEMAEHNSWRHRLEERCEQIERVLAKKGTAR